MNTCSKSKTNDLEQCSLVIFKCLYCWRWSQWITSQVVSQNLKIFVVRGVMKKFNVVSAVSFYSFKYSIDFSSLQMIPFANIMTVFIRSTYQNL